MSKSAPLFASYSVKDPDSLADPGVAPHGAAEVYVPA